MNALKSIGTKVVVTMIAAGLVAGAAFAAAGDTVSVKLPEAVSVGSTTLASGDYKINELTKADGSTVIEFVSATGESTLATATRSASPAADQKTEVVLTNEGGVLHLDKIFIAGDGAGYQFAESR